MTTRISPRNARTDWMSLDFKRGMAFAALCILVFIVLLLADRPHWATPWLLANIFTFGLWRMGRPRSP